MSLPTVCCVMLVNGREAMVKRAIESFKAQTYEPKLLLIWDSGVKSAVRLDDRRDPRIWYDRSSPESTIGAMRNDANMMACYAGPLNADLIANWDSDDYSNPYRLAEQVALLESSGKQCVGYRELLFWDTREARNEAWLYSDYNPSRAAGASFLYRRELWERVPFVDAPHEDYRWMQNEEVSRGMLSVSAIEKPVTEYEAVACYPRMVCQMHAGGTEQIPRSVMLEGGGGVWRRAPEYDAHCAKVMQL